MTDRFALAEILRPGDQAWRWDMVPPVGRVLLDTLRKLARSAIAFLGRMTTRRAAAERPIPPLSLGIMEVGKYPAALTFPSKNITLWLTGQ